MDRIGFTKIFRRRSSELRDVAPSTGERRAMNILSELHAAEEELLEKAVVLTDAKAGTVDHVYLDDVHGLRISIRGHEGRWPISTVKFIK